MQSEETWMELHVLYDHGWSVSALAREFGLDWRTARRYARAEKAPRYRPRDCPAELTAAQLAHVERRRAQRERCFLGVPAAQSMNCRIDLLMPKEWSIQPATAPTTFQTALSVAMRLPTSKCRTSMGMPRRPRRLLTGITRREPSA